MKKKLLSLLVLLMAVVTSAWAQDEQSWDSGNTTVTLSSDGVMTVSLKADTDGKMADYSSRSSTPWYDMRYKVNSVVVNDGVTSIGNYAFYGISYATSISIGKDVTSIGNYAFYGASNATSISIGKAVTSIGDYAFRNCNQITSITLPENLESIGNYSFYGCSSLTSISIPGKVTFIGNYAFYNCQALKSVTLPETLKTISDYAFRNCSKLETISFPSNLESIGRYAFYGCQALTSITIPASVTSIGDYAFYSCSGLIEVFVNATNPPTLSGYQTFPYFDGKIYVPFASVEAYRSAAYWDNYYSMIDDNLPKVSWASSASTDGWTVSVDGTALTLPASVEEGKTVTVEYTGTRTVDLQSTVALERDGNKWTFKMGDKPIALNSILGVAIIGETIYGSLDKALETINQIVREPTTVKLIWDSEIQSPYIGYETTIDLNGHYIAKVNDYSSIYVYNKLTVIDTSADQKGGVKMKFQFDSYNSNKVLSLVAGRYIYTADEINSNNYYAFGYIAENINADGSADADGYISKMRAMTADEKAQAAYDISKSKIVYTVEGVGTTDIPVIKYQEVRLTPPAGWKFGSLKKMNQWGGYDTDYAQYMGDYYWDGQTFKLNGNDVTESSIEINATLVPNSVAENLYGITATQSADKTAITLKGAGGKTVIIYSEKGEALFTQAVEKGNLATFKGLAAGKTYYLGVDGELLKVNTGE